MSVTLPPKSRILVIALRRLGDVLLTTPLIRSIRRAWSDATIDVLVFADTIGILTGNPDIDRVIAMPARPSAGESLALAARLAGRYALAISTQGGDRPVLFARLAGRLSIAPGASVTPMDRVKQALLTQAIPMRPGTHRVEEVLQLADALGIARVPQVVVPAGAPRPDLLPRGDYAVVHPAPMYRYKQWTADGWRALVQALASRGLAVVITGGPAPEERAYLDEIFAMPSVVVRQDGALNWHELAALTASARVFVGPDTSVTHLAAAGGAPTIALYGPTDPRLWGPWPSAGLAQPWSPSGTLQRRGNVWLVQNPLPCLPCQLEGCDRHRESHSQCLDELGVAAVLQAVDQALALQPGRSGAPA